MKRKALLAAVIASVLLAYAAASLSWGTAGWQSRGSAVNAAEERPEGGVRFPASGIAFAKALPPMGWVEAARRSHRLELSLSFRSSLQEQTGPARILTLSSGPYERNLTIGQQGTDLDLRLRTEQSSLNGMVDNKSVAQVHDVFLRDGWIDVDLVIEPGRLRMMVDDEWLVDESLSARPFETWDPSYRLALGNEIGGTRPWLGDIRRITMRAEDRITDYAGAGKLVLPAQLQISGPAPKLVPLVDLNRKDALNNVALYIPLGLVLGFLFVGRLWRIALAAWLFILGVSVSMELLQFFYVPARWPSVDDVIFNALGGGIGLLLALSLPWLWSTARR